MIKKRLIGILFSFALTAGIVAVAAPATAGTGTCQAGTTCLWADNSYDGGTVRFGDNKNDFSGYTMTDGYSANNRASSVSANHTTCLYSYLYDYHRAPYEGGSGSYIYFNKAGKGISRDPNLTNGGGNGDHKAANWNDRISSNWYKGC